MEHSEWDRPSTRAERLNSDARKWLEERDVYVPDDITMPIRKKDQNIFAVRIEEQEQEVCHGVTLHAKTIELGDGHFTNSYNLCVSDSSEIGFEIRSTQKPQYLHKLFRDERMYAAINAGFFYLSDESEGGPVDASFNMCVRDGRVVSLPARSSQVIVQRNGILEAQTVEAYGTVLIGDRDVAWAGAKSGDESNADAVLYNSACCHIYYDTTSDFRVKPRLLDHQKNTTPVAHDVCDIVVGVVNRQLRVTDIRSGGNTDFFAGNFVLHCPQEIASRIRCGDSVDPIAVGGIAIKDIQSAISVGAAIEDGKGDLNMLPVNNDPSLANRPFLDKRTARAVAYKDVHGIHLRVFDAARDSDFFKGLTPRETYDIIMAESGDSMEWGVHLDGSQSARMMVRDEVQKICEPYGNLHYTRWPTRALDRTDRYVFDPFRGRKVASSICLVKHSS